MVLIQHLLHFCCAWTVTEKYECVLHVLFSRPRENVRRNIYVSNSFNWMYWPIYRHLKQVEVAADDGKCGFYQLLALWTPSSILQMSVAHFWRVQDPRFSTRNKHTARKRDKDTWTPDTWDWVDGLSKLIDKWVLRITITPHSSRIRLQRTRFCIQNSWTEMSRGNKTQGS